MFDIRKILDHLNISFFNHKKRGSEYAKLFTASVQDASGKGIHEGDEVVVYMDESGNAWARKPAEFHDGRFELESEFMKDPFYNTEITKWLNNPNKITVFEGPDSSGKSTLVGKLEETLRERGYIVKRLSFPGNRADVNLREIILNSDMNKNTLGSVFLFLADFVHTYESEVLPYVNDNNVIFIFDRFIPSTAIYQLVSLGWINTVLSHPKFYGFKYTFSHAHYFYLNPNDENFDAHMERVAKRKKVGDVNYLDPNTVSEIMSNIEKYRSICEAHRKIGICGSTSVTVIDV